MASRDVIGALGGAVGLSVVTMFLYAGLQPAALRDGQFVTVLVFTLPFGALLGSAVGQILQQLGVGDSLRAGWVAVRFGGAVFGLAMLIIWWSAGSRGGGIEDLATTSLSLWIAPSWCAAAGMAAWGVFQVAKHRSSPGEQPN